ncbi:GNAT family N-acetyltransferase [Parerythrobacter jejuensis]|uniref:GNAT family N-acetyltransferase n=1 Tax=Parerythrobacter jejuensis TaxID=795812 RepID=A0A845B2H7_9SPHN|nr:GNAT family N-acetyltransferase [Parerythrobacter jejuensis]MXP30418.1 GNAT family N-acetyltransferase [Parerythrobacter jejuensis]MXP33178.1 GNAT family N-acetyltransferase [Parerythrobacter jejuensis]
MSDWSIRLARPGDADALPAVEMAAGTLFATLPDLAEFAGNHAISAERHRKLIARGHCLVALAQDAPIGFVATQPFQRELHVWEVSVHPDFQQRGIGATLMRACMIDARNAGFVALTLTTFRDVPWNGPFYEQIGFEEVTALDAHPRLAAELAEEADNGMPADRRIAMIKFLD